MRWREPSAGDVRTRSGFLLCPKTICGETRWLERAAWTERFHVSWGHDDYWAADAWLDGPRRPASEPASVARTLERGSEG